MKLVLNFEILVGLGRFLALCCYVLHDHLARHITAARCKVPSSPLMSVPKLPTQMRELHQQLVADLAFRYCITLLTDSDGTSSAHGLKDELAGLAVVKVCSKIAI